MRPDPFHLAGSPAPSKPGARPERSLRWLAAANLALGFALGTLVFMVPTRFLKASCVGEGACAVTWLDRLQHALIPLLAFAGFVGIALLLSRISGIAARLLLATPWVLGLASLLGLLVAALLGAGRA